jgi:hypothetical protein
MGGIKLTILWYAAWKTSVTLLDNLESFLSTFQKDLAAVTGQISELQDRSKDIDGRLKSRKVPTTIRSTTLSCWYLTVRYRKLRDHSRVSSPTLQYPHLSLPLSSINAIIDFEGRLVASKSRTRVKAARDLAEVIEGLRIVVSILCLVIII